MSKPKAPLSRKDSILLLVGFLCGAVLAGGMSLFAYENQIPAKAQPLRESNIPSASGYTLTDPLLGFSAAQSDSPEYADLELQVNKFLAQESKKGLAIASVNFRDILASEGFTINPDTLYNPASLLKVPVMMAYFDLAEHDPSILSQSIYYSGKPDLDADEQIKSPVQLRPGTYTVEELIEHMIRYSDNNALKLLSDHLQKIGKYETLTSLFDNLGVDFANVSTNVESVDVRSYSIFLRVLYNATYLDRDYSEKALALMTQTDFSEGIEDGVPNTVTVAQKFGDGKIADGNGNQTGAELQNCGIVYYPGHSYLLCLMTKGVNVEDLKSVISGVSKIIYEDMEHRYPPQ